MVYHLTVPQLTVETEYVLFDVSRIFRSRNSRFGTGVDRIDHAIGVDLLNRWKEKCFFIYSDDFGYKIFSNELGAAWLNQLSEQWRSNVMVSGFELPSWARVRLNRTARAKFNRVPLNLVTYVVASHSGLPNHPKQIKRLDPDCLLRKIFYLHDLIPIEYPEYQRPRTQKVFSAYLDNLLDARCVVTCNSNYTKTRLVEYLAELGRSVMAVNVAMPTVVETSAVPYSRRHSVEPNGPFFVILGTIEPRKNHLLLLNIWREFCSEKRGLHLVIVGRRGWENENIIDMLERCPGMRGFVHEYSGLADSEVTALLTNTKAMLFPSFVEGLGIPALEAAALGIPMILSDIPAFRDLDLNAHLIHPLDGLGWKKQILKLAISADQTQMPDVNQDGV